jgi:hypothetical protein
MTNPEIDSITLFRIKQLLERLEGPKGPLWLSALERFMDAKDPWPSNPFNQPLTEQAARLRKVFPELADATYDTRFEYKRLPPGTEGWFVFPRNWNILGDTYANTVYRRAFKALFFGPWSQGGDPDDAILCDHFDRTEEDPTADLEDHLRESAAKQDAMKQLREQQSGHDLIVVACRFGLGDYRRPSLPEVGTMQESDRFDLGMFEIYIVMLTHLHLLEAYDLSFYCLGDEVSDEGNGQFDMRPQVHASHGILSVVITLIDDTIHSFERASGFLPKDS